MSSDKIAVSNKDLFEQDEPDMSPFESFWQSHHGPDFNPYDWAQDFNRFDDAKNESKRAWEHSESEIKSLQSKLEKALKIGNDLTGFYGNRDNYDYHPPLAQKALIVEKDTELNILNDLNPNWKNVRVGGKLAREKQKLLKELE